MVMTYTHAKGQGQQSVGSKDTVDKTNGQTDKQMEVIALPVTNAVGIELRFQSLVLTKFLSWKFILVGIIKLLMLQLLAMTMCIQ